MPELPEVETTVLGLRPHAEQATITTVIFYRPDIRFPLDSAWIAHIEGRRIITIYRRAKQIIMCLDKGVLVWHLGMTGSLRFCQPGEVKRLHDHVELKLCNHYLLRFHDPRRFGYLKWFANRRSLQASQENLGVEPLSHEFSGDYLWSLARRKQQAVKNFIMNQAIVVGVGNIYACEALFLSGIRPQTPADKVSKTRYNTLVQEIKGVLQQAIEKGGTTLKDFINADAAPGYFQQSLLVYGRHGQSCQHCDKTIKTIKLAGRSSFYCPQCQR